MILNSGNLNMEILRKNKGNLPCVRSLSVVSGSMQNPWIVVHQAPLSVEFSRQEYWSGLPFPTPRDLPDPGIETVSLAYPTLAGKFFTTAPPIL